ncbi:DNA cytosine methyltransferase [Novosphingobium sp. MD-1]|uniref:DNA cytosine methyltransferase n=1 Tax=Novosphingobium sp. MD-1 TaxID=1630648 RepID=UPI00061BAB11|nr:DNA cytosine methyltransferase [Novosphingobium sp. MD-1]GAO55233.1 modification methylase [Novosphingobium sp. MD-1]
MSSNFKTVDIFAGPGGLAEGFSSLRDAGGERIFDIALSVEKEPSAFATLRLRAFTRQFSELPISYYDYISGRISRERLMDLHPAEWEAAVRETTMLELGSDSAREWLGPALRKIRENAGDRTVLIGGPPCQAYSLVGRARNRGIANYDAASDHRHFLYREYIHILEQLQPVAFVMENVKGMLSAKVNGVGMIARIMADLRSAGGKVDNYHILPLVADTRGGMYGHIVRAEEFGIPQARHRVILLGIRTDVLIRRGLPTGALQPLLASPVKVTVRDVLEGMPRLRSGLSRTADTPEGWRTAAMSAFREAATACDAHATDLKDVARRLRSHADSMPGVDTMPPRTSTSPGPIRDNRLADWLVDARVGALPNHESRGHMAGDLARYAFAATFAEVFGRSPKAQEFPPGLAPDHRNWESGKFADRFRVQTWDAPSTTVTSHISKDGHYFIHPDPMQCRSLTVREAARLQTFPDNYFFEGNRTQQYVQVGNAVPPLLAKQIAELLSDLLSRA